jgi:hypothetical protein
MANNRLLGGERRLFKYQVCGGAERPPVVRLAMGRKCYLTTGSFQFTALEFASFLYTYRRLIL